MEEHGMEKKACDSQQVSEVRKGPWTMEEDLILINYIATHGEGVWNNLARSAGLKRTGKSCRLRWLNYLRPDIRRGNITPEEQLLIMDLQARWGNRWSKIARQLPGRTDNEIKNFWRTRIQKKAKHADGNCTYDYDQKCSTQEGGGSDVDVYNKSSTTTYPTAEEGAGSSGHDGIINERIVPCSPMYVDDGHRRPDVAESNNVVVDGLWGVDDLWSIQLFNND